jgi:ribonuclease Z
MQVLEKDGLKIISSPVRHLVPTIGLRLENSDSGRVIAYSCDTEPCPSVVRLASGADILIHEASGAGSGHSSASQAGSVARESEVGKLILIHYPSEDSKSGNLLKQAGETYPGEVVLAKDFMDMEL